MGLRDRYNKGTAGATPAAVDIGTPALTLDAMRAKIAGGKAGGVNPPEAAESPLSVEPKTGPNGESPDASGAAAAVQSSSDPETSAPSAEPPKAARGRKPGPKAASVLAGPALSAQAVGETVAFYIDRLIEEGFTVTLTKGPA